MSVTTTLLDHLQATSSHGVDESAHPPLRYSSPFLLQQLSQICQSAVFYDSTIDRTLELVPKMLNWVEIRRVRRPHHSLNSRTSQELGDDSPPVWAGVIVHKDEPLPMAAACGTTCKRRISATYRLEFKFPFI